MRHTGLLTAVLLAAFVVLPGATPLESEQEQQAAPQVTFRAASNFVEVDAVITDEDGNFIRDLGPDDFEVLEDGQPVEVTTFALVDIPIERSDLDAADAAEAAADDAFYAEIVTNERDFDGRIYLIVLDANHVDPLRTSHVKDLAREFVLDNMSGSDQAAVVHLGDEAISQDFTSNRRLLLDSIDNFTGQKLRSAVLNKFDDATLKSGAEEGFQDVRDPQAIERASMARQSMQSVRNLADYMKGIRGRRKAMLYFSEGVTNNMYDTIGPSHLGHDVFRDNDATEAQYAADIALDMQNMIETATRSNVVVYTIDPRGLSSENDDSILLTGAVSSAGGLTGGVEDTDEPVGGGAGSPSSPENVMRGIREELNRSHNHLRSVAEQTGGIATVNTNNFDEGFDRIVRDNSTYYLLGYNTDPKYDGRFHEISVRVTRPDVEVRARKGYYALKEDPATSGETPDVLSDLLESPMPMSGMTMRVISQAFRGTAGNALVQMALQIDGEDVPFTDDNGTFTNTVELSYLAFDLDGNAQNRGSKILDLTLRPENRDAVSEFGLRFGTEFELAPGRYQMRLAAKEQVGAGSGSVFWDLVVPDFDQPLAMSDVALTSARTAAAPTVNDAETLKAVMPRLPSISRSFDLEDTLSVFAEVYSNRTDPQDIEVTTIVRDAEDPDFELMRESETRSTSEAAERGGLMFSREIPLIDLVPGRFVLVIEAQASAGGDPIVREIPFEIR